MSSDGSTNQFEGFINGPNSHAYSGVLGTIVSASNFQEPGETVAQGDGAASERKKRDRWTKAPDSDAADRAESKEGDTSKKKSRWGTKQEELPASNLSVVPFGSSGSMTAYGGLSTQGSPFGGQIGVVSGDQIKIQIRIAEIQSLYGRPRYVPDSDCSNKCRTSLRC